MSFILLAQLAGGLVGVSAAIGYWILRPMDLAARRRALPIQFSMVDFAALIVQLQLPLAWISSINSRATWNTIVWLTPTLCLLIAVTWWWGVMSVSRAGIRDWRRRTLFVAVVLPAAYLAALALVPMTFASLAANIHSLKGMVRGYPSWAYLVNLALPAVIVGCKWAVAWIVADPTANAPDELLPVLTESTAPSGRELDALATDGSATSR